MADDESIEERWQRWEEYQREHPEKFLRRTRTLANGVWGPEEIEDARPMLRPLRLCEDTRTATVFGRPKGKLTQTQWKILRALLDAGDDGLSWNDLQECSGSAVNVLKNLARKDADWARLILLAGVPGGRYRLKSR